MEKIIFKTKIDFEALEKYRDHDRDDLPVYGFQPLYKAIGLLDAAKKYQADHPDFFVDLLNKTNIACNFSTLRRIEGFIKEIWSVYSLSLDKKSVPLNEHVSWDTKKWAKGEKHYAKKLRKVVETALKLDSGWSGIALDDELGVNEIVLKVYEPDEQSEDNSEEKGAQA